MKSEADFYFRADYLYSQLKSRNIKLYFDNMGNVVAKGSKGQAVVFSDQFLGSEGECELKKAEALCKEFEVVVI